MRTMRSKIRSTAYPCKNYLNMHMLCSRLPLLSEATMFKLSLLIEQLDYTPSPLLSGVLYLANDPGSQHLMGRVAPRNVPSLDLEYVREVIARSCLALRSLLGRARNSYAAYTYRRRSAQEDYMPFENWMETSSFCGLCLHQMTVRVAPGWRRGSSTFSSRLGEMCTLASSKPNAKILRSFCWMRGSSIEPTWRGAWFGRIYFFARVSFDLPQELHALCPCGSNFDYGIAAVRVFSQDQISIDSVGYTAAFERGLRPKTYFITWDGIGGRIVLADHPEQENKKVILDIDAIEYPRPNE